MPYTDERITHSRAISLNDYKFSDVKDLIDKLQSIYVKYPESEVEIISHGDGDVDFKIAYSRFETEEEYQTRIEIRKKLDENQRKLKLLQYNKLKKELGL